jgi:pyridoxamine 5'-phosphate oxidase
MTFYDNLDLSFAEAQRLIETGVAMRKTAAHAPTVATINSNGEPSQRVMILREANWQARTLRFHTDRRSTKISEAEAQNAASVLFYLPEEKIQLRFAGAATIVTAGPEFDAAWDASTPFARRCYMSENAPGAVNDIPTSGLPDWIEGRQPTLDQITPAKANFSLFLFEFRSVEWLYLANSGHRRARWVWDSAAQDWRGCWLVP